MAIAALTVTGESSNDVGTNQHGQADKIITCGSIAKKPRTILKRPSANALKRPSADETSDGDDDKLPKAIGQEFSARKA